MPRNRSKSIIDEQTVVADEHQNARFAQKSAAGSTDLETSKKSARVHVDGMSPTAIEFANMHAKGAANREQMCEDVRRYRVLNPEKHRESRRRWQAANPEKRKALLRRSNAKKRATATEQLNGRISMGVRQSLKFGKQGRKWESLLGYNLNQIKRHLEKQFLPGMSWENLSQWHIDHKIPISAFNYEQPTDLDFKRCWALSNLRPLWKHDNLVKNSKIDKPFQPALLI